MQTCIKISIKNKCIWPFTNPARTFQGHMSYTANEFYILLHLLLYNVYPLAQQKVDKVPIMHNSSNSFALILFIV